MIESISFVIATSGKRLDMLGEVVKSIRLLGVPDYEIIIAGVVEDIERQGWHGGKGSGATIEDTILVPETLLPKGCKFFWKWGVEKAIKDWIAIVGDDFYFMSSWYQRLKDLDAKADVIGCTVINPDGTGYFRWADAFDLRILAQPELYDRGLTRDVYFSLYLCKRAVFDAIPLDPYNMGHDRKFGVECGFAGFRKAFAEDAKIIHLGSPQQFGGSGNVKYSQYTIKERLAMGEITAAIKVDKCVKCGHTEKELMLMTDECVVVDEFALVPKDGKGQMADMKKVRAREDGQ